MTVVEDRAVELFCMHDQGRLAVKHGCQESQGNAMQQQQCIDGPSRSAAIEALMVSGIEVRDIYRVDKLHRIASVQQSHYTLLLWPHLLQVTDDSCKQPVQVALD